MKNLALALGATALLAATTVASPVSAEPAAVGSAASPGISIAAVAKAGRTPTASLTLSSSSVSAGAPMTVSFTTSGANKRAKVQLQRTAGTANTFIKVAKLSRAGAFSLAAPPQGAYQFRIQVKNKSKKGRKSVAFSPVQSLFSYADVPLLTLCNASDNISFDDGCSTGSVPVGNNVFAYITSADYTTDPNSTTRAIETTKSSCRSLTLSYANSNDDLKSTGAPTTMNLSLRQQASDIQVASAPVRTVGAKTFSISSAAWSLNAWSTGGNYAAETYLNGSMSCYTADGDA